MSYTCSPGFIYIGDGMCLNMMVIILPCIAAFVALIVILACCCVKNCPCYHCCGQGLQVRHHNNHEQHRSASHGQCHVCENFKKVKEYLIKSQVAGTEETKTQMLCKTCVQDMREMNSGKVTIQEVLKPVAAESVSNQNKTFLSTVFPSADPKASLQPNDDFVLSKWYCQTCASERFLFFLSLEQT